MQKKKLSLNKNFLQATWLKCSFQQTVTTRRSHVPLTSQLPVPDVLLFPYWVTSGKDGKWLSNMHTHTQTKKKGKTLTSMTSTIQTLLPAKSKIRSHKCSYLEITSCVHTKKININTGSFRNIYLDFNESFRL